MRGERFKRLQTATGLIVLVMLLLSSLALGANRPVSWSLLSIGIAAMFFVQALIMLGTPTPLAMRRAVLPGVLFIAAVIWGWVQSTPGLLTDFAHPVWALVPEAPGAISADPGQGRHAVMRLFCYAMIFVVMIWTCAKSERAGLVLKMIALFSTLLAAYGLWAFLTGNNPILQDLTRGNSLQASFVNRNNYATYAAFGVFANIAAYLHVAGTQALSMRQKIESFFSGSWVFALGALVCIGALSLTQSRAGVGSALIGLLVFVISWQGRRRGGSIMLPIVLIAVLIFVGATSATGFLERLIASDGTDARFAVYPAMIEGIMDRPLLGHGIGAFHEAFRPYIPIEGAYGEWVRAHSTYLELAFGLGLPATAALLLAQVLLIWRIWRGTIKRRENRVFSCFALACAVTAALHSVFDFSLQMPATAALFATVLALGFAQSFSRGAVDAFNSASKRSEKKRRPAVQNENQPEQTAPAE